jgi:hypothetical protein
VSHRNCILAGTLSLFVSLLVRSEASTRELLSQSQEDLLVKGQSDVSLTVSEVEGLIRQFFGDLFVLASDKGSPFVVGDFNGDGNKDFAVAVRLSREIDRDDNSTPDFLLYVPVPPEFDGWENPNPLGTLAHWRRGDFLVVLHSRQGSWHQLLLEDKAVLLISYAGSSIKLFSFRGQLRPATAYPGQRTTGPPPSVKYDSILLDQAFSNGNGQLIYWDGARYRYYPVDIKVKR